MTPDINAAIDAALVRDGAMQASRNYLGGSRLGEPCARKLRFEWDDIKSNLAKPGSRPPPFNGKAYRRFAMGHLHEALTVKWLLAAGFDLRVHNDDGSQYAFGEEGVPLAGHIDGVLIDGPVKLPYPMLWEHKIMNKNNWQSCAKSGVESSKPVYYGQLQVYMKWTGLTNALFTALNTDTSELYFEVVEYEPEVATRLLERGKQVIEAPDANAVPRITMDPADFQCRWCDFKDRCWASVTATPAAPVAASKPVWARG